MTIHDYVKAILAACMWSENNGDGIQGMTAVGLVIRNRVNAGWNGGDWCAVMEVHNTAPLRWPDTRDPNFRSLLWKVDTIYDGSEEDITGGALYYCELAKADEHFTETIVRNTESHRRIGTVGKRTFFI